MSDPATPPLDPPRLNGWKEVATHLGKGVRTVQRWEKLYGLPVHRLGEGGGEIVFAFRHEIDEWLRTVERTRPEGLLTDAGGEAGANGHHVARAPGRHPVNGESAGNIPAEVADRPRATPEDASSPRSRRRFLVAAGTLGLVVVITSVWLAATGAVGSRAKASPKPSTFRFDDQSLIVFDASGGELWRHPHDAPLPAGWQPAATGSWSGPVAILDLDGDGSREVLLAVPFSPSRQGQALICFNADGSRRWTRLPADTQRYGGADYTAPWVASHFLPTRNADGTRTIWAVFSHGLLFPSVLEQIDRFGQVKSRYWSNGYISSLGQGTWDERPVLFVGAANNEHKATSLAILDRANPSGTAPAANPKYRCGTCPPGDPLAFVVFPPSPVGLVRDDTTGVHDAWVNAAGELTVNIEESVPGVDGEGGVYFTLDQLLRPRRIEVSRQYQHLHDSLFRQGRLDRAYSEAEQQRMGTVLRWGGTAFVEVPLSR